MPQSPLTLIVHIHTHMPTLAEKHPPFYSAFSLCHLLFTELWSCAFSSPVVPLLNPLRLQDQAGPGAARTLSEQIDPG